MTGQVLALFPVVHGEVLEVQDNRLTLSLALRDGIQPGLSVTLYREGHELRHPRTGQVLGRTEEILGRATIDDVRESYSVASVNGSATVKPGDRVRTEAGRVKLTVLPVVDTMRPSLAEATTFEMVESLNRTGRFQAVRGDQVSAWLLSQRIEPAELLAGRHVEEVGRQFGVEYLLGLRLTTVERKPYMEITLRSPARSAPLLASALFVPSTIKPPEERAFSGGQAQGPAEPRLKQRSLLARLLGGDLVDAGSYSSSAPSIPLQEVARFPFAATVIDLSRSPKDGMARLLVSDGRRVSLYRIDDRKLEAEWSYTPSVFGQVISAQLADLDDDGQLEAVVMQYHPDLGLRTSVVAAKGGKPTEVARTEDVIFVALDDKGDGVKRTLWGQRMNRVQFFPEGQAETYVVRNRALEATGRVATPESFRATGAVFTNIAGKQGPRALAYVDQYQRLRIASGYEELWRSSTPVGGGYVTFEVKQKGSLGPGLTVPSKFVKLEPLPLAVDLDGDGIDEIVVPQEQAPGMLAVVFRGPAGYRLQLVNSGFEGSITGLGAIPGAPGESPTLIASVVRFTGFIKKSGETQVIMTVPQ